MRRAALTLLIVTLPTLFACDNSGTRQPATDVAHASRIVTLAPNLAELVFAAGAGDTLVGVSAYSDFPPAVAALPHGLTADLAAERPIRLLPADGAERITIPLRDVAAIQFTGRDTAEGRSFETWVRKYVQRKLAGEPANIETTPEDAG